MQNMSQCFRTLKVIIFFCLCWREILAEDSDVTTETISTTTTTSKTRYGGKHQSIKHAKRILQKNPEEKPITWRMIPVITYRSRIFPGFETKKPLFDKQHLYKSRLSYRNFTELPRAGASETLSPYAIVTQMMRIFKHFEDANVTTEILGRTVEYNDIVLFKISSTASPDVSFRSKDNKYIDEVPQKKIIFIVHGLTVMGIRMMDCLTEEDKLKILIGYYLKHLDHFDIYLIPMANPDGYVMAGRPEGYWNKNRAPQADCAGVMLDRNFDVAWNYSNKLSSCSQNYPGPRPFSEAETRAIRDVFHYHGHKILAYIHVHPGSYDTKSLKGEAILYPSGFTDVALDDDKYIDLKGEVDEAIKNASFTVLSVTMDDLYSWYGPVTGTSVDYASTIYGIPFAMEFVMQLYVNNFWASQDEEMVEYMALTQVWSRLIDVVFKYLWKSSHGSDIMK